MRYIYFNITYKLSALFRSPHLCPFKNEFILTSFYKSKHFILFYFIT